MAEKRGRETSVKDWDYPPNSRLFIVCSKTTTEDEFHEAFGKFGKIEDVWIVKDKATGDSKGVAYIKFAKTSQAALAMEEMNGVTLPTHAKSLKVLIAHSRHDGSRRDANEEERLLRLFVILPKSYTDANVREHFEQFGDIDFISIIKDKKTGDSKGYGYVKYLKVSQAAKAFESCDKMYKAVFAEPKPSGKPKDFGNFSNNATPMYGNSSNMNMMSDVFGDLSHLNPEGIVRIQIMPHPNMTQPQLSRLCGLIPGLDYCDISRDGLALVKYVSPQSAAWAKEKLQGFEYPPGFKLQVRFYDDRGSNYGDRGTFSGRGGAYGDRGSFNDRSSGGGGGSGNFGDRGGGSGFGDRGGGGGLVSGFGDRGGGDFSDRGRNSNNMYGRFPSPTPASVQPKHGGTQSFGDLQNNLATLAQTLAQTTSLIQAAALGQSNTGQSSHSQPELSNPDYCSANLPPPQRPASPGATLVERLFVVSSSPPCPEYALRDCLSRFGYLIDFAYLPGKNYGYARYSNKDSALDAIECLNNQYICNQQVRVLVADPYKDGERGSKRQRVDSLEVNTPQNLRENGAEQMYSSSPPTKREHWQE